jgi:hypothetical protein
MTTTPPPNYTVNDEADLFALWQRLMAGGGFARRSLWLIFLDHNSRILPVILPIDDIPAEPDAAFVANIAHIIGELVSNGEASTAALLLSRPGPTQMTAADRRWAHALIAALGPEFDRWPIHLASRDAIQVFAPDDLCAPRH